MYDKQTPQCAFLGCEPPAQEKVETTDWNTHHLYFFIGCPLNLCALTILAGEKKDLGELRPLPWESSMLDLVICR